MLMAKAPGSWSSLLAKVIGLGSRLWLLAPFQWIWLANIVGSGYWPGLLPQAVAQVVDPCYWRMPKVFGPVF